MAQAPDAGSRAPSRTTTEQRRPPTQADVGELEAADRSASPTSRSGCVAARPGLLGSQRVPPRAGCVPACREGRSRIRRGAQLAGRRARRRNPICPAPSPSSARRSRSIRNTGEPTRTSARRSRRAATTAKRYRCSGKRWRSSRTASAAHLNLGMALAGDRRPRRRARTSAAGARRPTRTTPSVQYELGQTLRQGGDLTGAIAAFERALEIDPELREGYYALGNVAEAAGPCVCAKAVTSAGERRPPICTSSAQDALGRADLARARASTRRSPASRRDASPNAHTLLGFTLGQQGRPFQAIAHLERAVALSPSPRRRTTISAWRSGTAARRTAPSRSLRESVKLDPAAARAATRFSARCCASAATWLARASACSAPSRSCRRRAAVYVDLGITYLPHGRARPGDSGSSKPG